MILGSAEHFDWGTKFRSPQKSLTPMSFLPAPGARGDSLIQQDLFGDPEP